MRPLFRDPVLRTTHGECAVVEPGERTIRKRVGNIDHSVVGDHPRRLDHATFKVHESARDIDFCALAHNDGIARSHRDCAARSGEFAHLALDQICIA